jgi:MATE family, multidrug efflux pump
VETLLPKTKPPSADPSSLARGRPGKFTQGSTMRHVLVMASTGAIGLLAVFFVDLANLFYISLLGQQELAAAIGYAATIMFFTISVSIGFAVAATAITARAFGSRNPEDARRKATASLVFAAVIGIAITAGLYPMLGTALSLLGASGRTYEISLGFMQIVVFSLPLMGIGMCAAGLLRAQGDARRAMYVTLVSGMSAAALDPLFIFGLDLGINGAAISTVIVRGLFVAVGFHGLWFVHRMLALPSLRGLHENFRPFMAIAAPAVLTQIATPIGNAYVTGTISRFGDDAVAGWAIVGRIMPLAFAGIFSLSGAVGPIIGQNFGAGLIPRVHQTVADSLKAALVYVLAVWAILAVLQPSIVQIFGATGDAAELIRFFCLFVAGSFAFNAALFVAISAFNNLGFPLRSTLFNWGRATAGVIPFVYFGREWGPQGVLAGWALGGVVFGTLAVLVCFRTLRHLSTREAEGEGMVVTPPPTAHSPFTSGKGAMIGRISPD